MAKADAISMLKADHKTMRELLGKLSETTDRGIKTRRHLLERIERELKTHTMIEEEIFYPAFKSAAAKKEDQKLVAEAKEEHHAADKVLKDLASADPATVAFGGKAKVLLELVEHHADEEEKEMFPRAKKLLDRQRLEALAEQMETRRTEIENGRAWDRSRAAVAS